MDELLELFEISKPKPKKAEECCDHVILMCNGFEICGECGKYISAYFDIKYPRSYMWGEPVNIKAYSHSTRFKKLLNRLLMKSSPPPNKVIIYVRDKNPKSLTEIRNILKKSHFRTKYYEYMSFFGCYLLDLTFKPISDTDLKNIYAYFIKCSQWGKERSNKKIFAFPYPFILKKIFKDRSDISILLNDLKCKKRQKIYDDLWTLFNKECPIPNLKTK